MNVKPQWSLFRIFRPNHQFRILNQDVLDEYRWRSRILILIGRYGGSWVRSVRVIAFGRHIDLHPFQRDQRNGPGLVKQSAEIKIEAEFPDRE